VGAGGRGGVTEKNRRRIYLQYPKQRNQVIVPAVETLAGELHASSGAQGAPGRASFFVTRVVVLTGAPPAPAVGACGAAGEPGGMQGVSASEAPGATVPPTTQYDLITDLLDANMFKVYADMLKSDKQRVKGDHLNQPSLDTCL
jgi:hypothetical protein